MSLPFSWEMRLFLFFCICWFLCRLVVYVYMFFYLFTYVEGTLFYTSGLYWQIYIFICCERWRNLCHLTSVWLWPALYVFVVSVFVTWVCATCVFMTGVYQACVCDPFMWSLSYVTFACITCAFVNSDIVARLVIMALQPLIFVIHVMLTIRLTFFVIFFLAMCSGFMQSTWLCLFRSFVRQVTFVFVGFKKKKWRIIWHMWCDIWEN